MLVLVFRNKICVYSLITAKSQSMSGFCGPSEQPAWAAGWMAFGSAWGGAADWGLFQSPKAKDNLTMLTGVLVNMCLACFR